MTYRLVDAAGTTATIGASYTDFRGERHTLEGSRPPHKPDSTGRVYTDRGEFYPSVIGLAFVEAAPAEDHTPDHIVDAINADVLRKA
jgi:hypothetical protein